MRYGKLTTLVSPLVEKLHGIGKRVIPGMNLVARVPVGADLNRVGWCLGGRHGRSLGGNECRNGQGPEPDPLIADDNVPRSIEEVLCLKTSQRSGGGDPGIQSAAGVFGSTDVFQGSKRY